jgi:hypothetical protein
MRLAFYLLTAVGLALASAQALDLTPQRSTRQGNEGPPTPVIQFADGAGQAEFCPPRGWEASGGGDSLTFFTSDSASYMKLQVVAKSKDQDSRALSTEELQKWALQFMPTGAESVEFVKMVPAPYMLGSHMSKEFIFNYTRLGARASVSVSFVDRGKEWLVMSVSAGAKSFAQIRQQAIASMFSWSEEG